MMMSSFVKDRRWKIGRRLFALRQGSVILNGRENEQMNLGVCVGIAAILFASACTSLDKGVQQSKQKTTVGQRVERFAKSLTRTVTDVTSDVLPILTATTNEIVHEVKSDLPKVAEELGSQMRRITSVRSSGEAGP